MDASTKSRGTELVHGTESVPIITQEHIRKRIDEATKGIEAGKIAQIVECSKDTVKSWRKKNGRCPHASHLARLSRGLPCVQEVLAEEFGISRAMASASNDAVNAIVRRSAMGEGPNSAFCRQIIREAEGMAEMDSRPQLTVVPQTVKDAWRFQDGVEERAWREEYERSRQFHRDLLEPTRRRA